MTRITLLAVLFAAGYAALCGIATDIGVMERNGRSYVSATVLKKAAGVLVKRLPDGNASHYVACAADRCAVIPGAFVEDEETWLPTDALTEALDAELTWDAPRRLVSFRFSSESDTPSASTVGVGNLAPDFRLTLLDGSPLALSTLRGRRVLINSWASW